MSIHRKLMLIGAGLFAIFIAGIVFLSSDKGDTSSTLNIEVVPGGSELKVDAKGYREGSIKVTPGTHTVTVSKEGFEKISETVNILKNESKYLGFILNSNSPSTNDWYKKHPEDAKKAEGISSKNFDQSTKDALKKYPLIAHLPKLDRYFRIDYSVTGNASERIATIKIRANNDLERKMALDWIRSQGFDPANYKIIYE